METALFRAVQEAITNIVKHARAESVLIQCALGPRAVTIEIEDDGEGFDPASISGAAAAVGGRGLGLAGIRERIELLGGSAIIESAPGQGTRVVLTVPLERGSWIRFASSSPTITRLMRDGIKALLGLAEDIEVVGEASRRPRGGRAMPAP